MNAAAPIIEGFNPTYWWIRFSIENEQAVNGKDGVSILLIGGYGLVSNKLYRLFLDI